ncbi:MAG TPA: glycosyltransferase family 39 protein, partial [Usitatibacter sp.]|nr:glycosyltransferase family 39 protein [Usitatibacter sp.]
ALFTSLSSTGMPVHDAARLATTFFVLVSLLATAAAARLCWGPGSGAIAVLLYLATLGLEGHAQRMQVDHALMAGFALAVLGLAAFTQGRAWSGAVLGLGIGIGFLAKGLIAPGAIGLAAALLPVFFREWRDRRYGEQLLYAAAVALPAAMPWPLLLWLRDPLLFHEWFWENNVGRFAGFSIGKLGGTSEPGFWPQTLPWFLFPLWVFSLGSLRREGRGAGRQPGMQIGITLTLVVGLVLLTSASGRAIYALPLLPPMVLMSIPSASTPEAALARTLRITAIAIGTLAAIFFWGIWGTVLATSRVPAWTRLQEHLPVPFDMPVGVWTVGGAVALTAGFLALVAFRSRLPRPALTLWVGSVALAWGLAMTLLLPWFDASKSYREVFTEASRHLPPDTRCIVLYGLGESERAMVEYYMHVPPRSAGVREQECGAALWMGSVTTLHHYPDARMWKPVWSGNRPGELSERFELFAHAAK